MFTSTGQCHGHRIPFAVANLNNIVAKYVQMTFLKSIKPTKSTCIIPLKRMVQQRQNCYPKVDFQIKRYFCSAKNVESPTYLFNVCGPSSHGGNINSLLEFEYITKGSCEEKQIIVVMD